MARAIDIDTTLGGLVVTVGSPLLVLLYALEGLLVGKLLHPSLLFILYVVVTEPGLVLTGVVGAFCVGSATAGQLVLYRTVSEDEDSPGRLARVIPYLDRLPEIVKERIGDSRLALVDRWFDRFGGHAVWISNATPGLRGLMTIPAGLSGYPVRRFVVLSALGNAMYMVLLIAVANGLLEAVRFVPWDLSPDRFL